MSVSLKVAIHSADAPRLVRAMDSPFYSVESGLDFSFDLTFLVSETVASSNTDPSFSPYSRSTGDSQGSMMYYQESVDLLLDLPNRDEEVFVTLGQPFIHIGRVGFLLAVPLMSQTFFLSGLLSKIPCRMQVVHALSVSLNKLGDLKYYAQDLTAARSFYSRALEHRQQSTDLTILSSQVTRLCLFVLRGTFVIEGGCVVYLGKIFRLRDSKLVKIFLVDELCLTCDLVACMKVLDVAVSLAKVADVNRALGDEESATEGFQEAVKMLEGLPKPKAKDHVLLEPRVSYSATPIVLVVLTRRELGL